jgi:3-(3-hydroxy-phenyl)propionate hydroxylase
MAFGTMEIVSEKGQVMLEETLIQPGVEHGYTGSRFFDQPAFEEILRKGLLRFPNVLFMPGKDTIEISQTENDVHVSIQNTATGEMEQLQGLWAVGCDGGRSMVRTALQIEMDSMEPARDWVIVDTLLKKEADVALLPKRFRYMLLPERLSIFAYGMGINNRWEFQLNKNEAMPDDAIIKKWVSKYIDLDKVEITRIAKYAHSSLVARTWSDKRIFLAGDAAHMMPPSAGQGLCSGVRDAVNLAWKLDAVIKKTAPLTLLDSYEQERKQHLLEILKRTLFISSRLQADNPMSRWWRAIELRLINNLRPLRNFLADKYNIPAKLKSGYLNAQSPLAGTHLPQANLSDDLIGYRFALIALPGVLSPEQFKTAEGKTFLVLDRQPVFTEWLQKHEVDFAIIRPDKIVWGAAKADEFDKMIANF